MNRVLSICTGAGLLDRAFLDAGFDVTPACEIDPDMRGLYRLLCGGEPLFRDVADVPAWLLACGRRFDGVIGGPPCQSHTKLRAIRSPKFPDLTRQVAEVLAAAAPSWFLFENVAPVGVPDARHAALDAMHYARPHQSRPRWFSHSPNLTAPAPAYAGTVDDLMAYSIVAGRIYGPKRGAVLQGYPDFARLTAPCVVLQKGLANAVHYAVGSAWAEAVKASLGARKAA